jgi:hypothetical protein
VDRLKGTLTARVGPLPAYAWAVLILGAYLAYSYISKTGFFAPKSATAADTTGGGGAPPGLDGGGGFPTGGAPIGGAGSTGTTGDNIVNPVPSYYSPSDGGFQSNALASMASPLTGVVDVGGATYQGSPSGYQYSGGLPSGPAYSQLSSPSSSGYGPPVASFINTISSYVAARGSTSIPQPTPGVSGGGRFIGGHGAQ